MSNLWEPQNIHAVPTPSETKLAKESIESLEVQLQQAKRDIKTLKQKIKERRAWIAPIRRIPHDVLSLIFLEVCRKKWSAPLILGQVCHVWRESIIAYPRAWSYFQLQGGQSNELQSLFLSRSAPCSLHLRLSCEFDSRTFELFASVIERIKCLSLNTNQVWNLRGHRFPAIERLHIDGDIYADTSDRDLGFILNNALFPRLRSLNAGTFMESIKWDTPPFPKLVPLQVLSLRAEKTNVWRNIVECCSHTLTSLELTLYKVPIHGRNTISLPRLESLPAGWPIGAQTPALQTYLESSPLGPIHEDTQSVTSLHFRVDIDLSKFPQVRQMTMLGSKALHNAVHRLVNAPAICPNLDTIVDDLSGAENFLRSKTLIAAWNKQTGRKIQFRRPHDDGVILYQHLRERNCGYNNPCAYRW